MDLLTDNNYIKERLNNTKRMKKSKAFDIRKKLRGCKKKENSWKT